MRAVLLVKPSIVLFSSDTAPSNVGPSWRDLATSEDASVKRTCNCLTTLLGSFGCGAVVGYHMIRPCDRCTASVALHQRTANNHRYVFHQHVIVSTERTYSRGEPGIVGAAYRAPPREIQGSPSPPPLLDSPESQVTEGDAAKEGSSHFLEGRGIDGRREVRGRGEEDHYERL